MLANDAGAQHVRHVQNLFMHFVIGSNICRQAWGPVQGMKEGGFQAGRTALCTDIAIDGTFNTHAQLQ